MVAAQCEIPSIHITVCWFKWPDVVDVYSWHLAIIKYLTRFSREFQVNFKGFIHGMRETTFTWTLPDDVEMLNILPVQQGDWFALP